MTTNEIEAMAQRSRLSTGDFDMKSELRFNIIPQFLLDVGDTAWVRRNTTISSAADERDVALPRDFYRMRKVGVPTGYSLCLTELPYYGEDDGLVLERELATDSAAPTSYTIIAGTDGKMRTLRWNCPADAVYTYPISYRLHIPFRNAEEDVDLDQYIPLPLQFALVEGLRKEYLAERMGEGDYRYVRAAKEYDRWVARARMQQAHEPGPRGSHFVYAR